MGGAVPPLPAPQRLLLGRPRAVRHRPGEDGADVHAPRGVLRTGVRRCRRHRRRVHLRLGVVVPPHRPLRAPALRPGRPVLRVGRPGGTVRDLDRRQHCPGVALQQAVRGRVERGLACRPERTLRRGELQGGRFHPRPRPRATAHPDPGRRDLPRRVHRSGVPDLRGLPVRRQRLHAGLRLRPGPRRHGRHCHPRVLRRGLAPDVHGARVRRPRLPHRDAGPATSCRERTRARRGGCGHPPVLGLHAGPQRRAGRADAGRAGLRDGREPRPALVRVPAHGPPGARAGTRHPRPRGGAGSPVAGRADRAHGSPSAARVPQGGTRPAGASSPQGTSSPPRSNLCADLARSDGGPSGEDEVARSRDEIARLRGGAVPA